VLARVPGAQRLRRDYRALRLRLAAELDRLSEAGRREEREARLLARLTLDGLFELVAGRLADSPELQQVIEQQSQGLTSSAMAQLREQSARADRTAENIARWLTGHRPRGGR
jgi:hypothetical protein